MNAVVKKINSARSQSITPEHTDIHLPSALTEIALNYNKDPEVAAASLREPVLTKQNGLKTNGQEYYQILPDGTLRPVDRHTYWGVLRSNEKAILYEGKEAVTVSVRRMVGSDMELVLSADGMGEKASAKAARR